MAELAVIDSDTENLADFAAGFAAETPPDKPAVTEAGTTPVVQPAPVAAAPVKEGADAEPKDLATVTDPAPEAPKYVQVTQEEWDSLKATAGKTAAIEQQLSKVFGTMGNMQQVVTKLQASTPAGMTVELPKDVVSELEKDFPELAPHMRSALEKALKGIRGTGTQAETPEQTDRWRQMIQEASVKYQMEALEEDHSNWREIVGTVDAEGKHDPNNDFRKWLATQTAEYQAKVNNANSAAVVSKAIERFLAAKAAPAPKAQTPAPKIVARQAAIRAAVQPRGDGGQPASSTTVADAFNEGFRGG